MMNFADDVIGYEEFKARYLASANNLVSATRFWNTYNNDSINLLNNRQFLQLRDRLFSLLKACKRIDTQAFAKIHKGHPFYYIGIVSYLLQDYQTAIYFFDAAVTEDINSGADPINKPTPSTRFLMLDGESDLQAAKELTKNAQSKVERVLKYYHDQINKNPRLPYLSLDNLRKNFISYALLEKDKPGLRTLVTSFITYVLEWDFRNEHFEYDVDKGTSEPFVLHLFRGCILLESLLKHNPTNPPVNNVLGGILKEEKIVDKLMIDPILGKKDGFTLDDVFDRLLEYDNSISAVMQISYMARNTLGHTLGWNTNISQNQYSQLYLIIASSCLHAIACLWNVANKSK